MHDLSEVILRYLDLIGADLRRKVLLLYHEDLLAFLVDVDLETVLIAIISLKGFILGEAC